METGDLPGQLYLFGPPSFFFSEEQLQEVRQWGVDGISEETKREILETGHYASVLTPMSVSTDLGREELFELGRKRPYHRYVEFPTSVEIPCPHEKSAFHPDDWGCPEEKCKCGHE